MNELLILFGKLIIFTSKALNKGNGSTWPGHIALSVNQKFLSDLQHKNPQLKIIFVTGTNGKTTTSKMIAEIFIKAGKRVFHNESGANLLNGLASTFIKASDLTGDIPYDYLIFEIDENWLPKALERVTPAVIVLLNLFRDQLDRYGELRMIAAKWMTALTMANGKWQMANGRDHKLSAISHPPALILNADDPLIAYLGYQLRTTNYELRYFGLPTELMEKKKVIHGADSIYCPYCGEKLIYKKISYSHLGDWKCPSCGLQRPRTTNHQLRTTKLPLAGTYNQYNAIAAATTAGVFGVDENVIINALTHIGPAFGRQEKIQIGDKFVEIILSKNPTGSNQSIETVLELARQETRNKKQKTKKDQTTNHELRTTNYELPTVLFVLNDQIPDGTDVSWIWDTDLEEYIDSFRRVIVSGDRAYDMALRVNYSGEFPMNDQGFSIQIKLQSTSRGSKSDRGDLFDDQLLASQQGGPTTNDGRGKLIIKEDLKEAIVYGLSQVDEGETLYILPTYSAMLEVRKIITGKAIL